MLYHYYYLQKNPTQPKNIPFILNQSFYYSENVFLSIHHNNNRFRQNLIPPTGKKRSSGFILTSTEAYWSVVKFIESNGKNGFRMTVRMLCHVAGLYTVHYVLFQKAYHFYTKLWFSSECLLIISSITLYVEVHNLLNIVYINVFQHLNNLTLFTYFCTLLCRYILTLKLYQMKYIESHVSICFGQRVLKLFQSHALMSST